MADSRPTPRPGSTPESELRHNSIGTTSLVFLVLATAAPLGGFVFNVPLVIGFGVGAAAPGIYLLVALALFCFAVGYAAMSAHMVNAGAFYAYIARGLGTRIGLSAAYIAVFAYTAILIAVCAVFGYFANFVIDDELGIDLPWQVWAAALLLALAAVAYRRVDLNARVLSVIFIAEIVLILVLDAAILIDRGFGAFSLDAFDPSLVFGSHAGVALTFAFASFIGFEATAIFAEETKDPKKSVPRATYLTVALVGGFFAISSWALIAGAGASDAGAIAGEDPGGFVFGLMDTHLGSLGVHALNFLILTSLAGTALGGHNGGARYIFALARDGVLPRRLARTHPTHRSPYVASLSQLAVVTVVLAIFALAGADPVLVIGTALVGVGTLGILSLQAAVSLAVIAFFWGHAERHWWRTLLAPMLGAAALIGAIVVIIDNYELVGRTEYEVLNLLPWLLVVLAIGGAAYGTWLRSSHPEEYATVSRALDADMLDPEPAPIPG